MNEMEIREKRKELESLIRSWNGTKMWFQERRLQFPGIVQIITDDWGVSITITSEYFRKFSVVKPFRIFLQNFANISSTCYFLIIFGDSC